MPFLLNFQVSHSLIEGERVQVACNTFSWQKFGFCFGEEVHLENITILKKMVIVFQRKMKIPHGVYIRSSI